MSDTNRRTTWLSFSLRGLGLLVVGLSIGLAVGLHYSPFRKMAPNEAFAYDVPDYIIEPPDVLSVTITYPSRIAADVDDQCLVGPDGRIGIPIGDCSSVFVTGLTISDAKQELQQEARKVDPEAEATVTIEHYNSKKMYLISETPGGDNIVAMPFTGNDHVLDVLPHADASKPLSQANIWISRPRLNGDQILPVDYEAITVHADPLSNYQLLPGDRVFVSSKPIPPK